MPSNVLRARFVKDGQTVSVEIAGPWWPTGIFERERADDQAANHATYEAIRATLIAEGHREVED
jgi:hypothetical protein